MTRFAPGTRIVTRAQHKAGHTRLPGYLQQKPGIVLAFLGAFKLPDENAIDPRHARVSELYTVRFDAADVFGDAGDGQICADLFDEYFEEVT